jgi:hypothetical protein
MLLVLLSNYSIKSGHFVSSEEDRVQSLCNSDPFARLQMRKCDADGFYLPLLTFVLYTPMGQRKRLFFLRFKKVSVLRRNWQ